MERTLAIWQVQEVKIQCIIYRIAGTLALFYHSTRCEGIKLCSSLTVEVEIRDTILVELPYEAECC